MLKRYAATVNGMTTTLKLTEAEAKKRGLVEASAAPPKKGRAPSNKGRAASNKGRSTSTKVPDEPPAPDDAGSTDGTSDTSGAAAAE